MNTMYETSKAFENADNYQDRIVAFVDVMGIKNRMKQAATPKDLKMYATLLNGQANQPFAEGKLHITMFSDCMYIICEKQYLDHLVCQLANMAYTMLMNRLPTIHINEDESHWSEIDWDCFKLRGGITYGKVFVVDQAAKDKGILLNTNIVLGQAPITAYELESSKAIYPRIITDNSFIGLLNNLGKSPEEYFFTKDEKDSFFYLDFLDYMCQGKREGSVVFSLLNGCIEYIKKELDHALLKNNAKLAGQLLWYIRYLESHLC